MCPFLVPVFPVRVILVLCVYLFPQSCLSLFPLSPCFPSFCVCLCLSLSVLYSRSSSSLLCLCSVSLTCSHILLCLSSFVSPVSHVSQFLFIPCCSVKFVSLSGSQCVFSTVFVSCALYSVLFHLSRQLDYAQCDKVARTEFICHLSLTYIVILCSVIL